MNVKYGSWIRDYRLNVYFEEWITSQVRGIWNFPNSRAFERNVGRRWWYDGIRLNSSLGLYDVMLYLTFQSVLVTWRTTSLTFNNCTFCPHCIYVFCIYLRTNSDLCHLQHKLIGFYNRDGKCLQRGTDWGFK